MSVNRDYDGEIRSGIANLYENCSVITIDLQNVQVNLHFLIALENLTDESSSFHLIRLQFNQLPNSSVRDANYGSSANQKN